MKEPLVSAIWSACRVASATALVAGASCPTALAAPGDLDPTFADVGRFAPSTDFATPAWSIEGADDSSVIFAGGSYENDFYTQSAEGFVGLLTSTGEVDSTFVSSVLNAEVLDTAIQPDGKVIGVGRMTQGRAQIFRLERDGSFDGSFGDGGAVILPGKYFTSVLLDPDGRIVVAGTAGSNVMVLRLLADGQADESFGDAGFFISDAIPSSSRSIERVLRIEDGGYRVAMNYRDAIMDSCHVLALKPDGTLDESFGDHGYAGLGFADQFVQCNAFAETSRGELLVAGVADTHAFAIRLLGSGVPDATFEAAAATGTMTEATALSTGPNDSVVIAGVGADGAAGTLVMRVRADGSIDPVFGNSGSTWIDLPSQYDAYARSTALRTLANGAVLVAGAAGGSFVARLEGDDGEDGPGVIGVMRPEVDVTEEEGAAVVTVRRMGGAAGAVSIAYHTRPAGHGESQATAAKDFTPTSGRLDWTHGDVSNREITIPILPGSSAPEEPESFELTVDDVQGGAGLGTQTATVTIAADGVPSGQFAIHADGNTAFEPGPAAQVVVDRLYYGAGTVSVTVTPVSGTATAGEDFTAAPVTLTWADGDMDTKTVEIPLTNDSQQEPTEDFTVELTDPTGGAVIGPRSSVTMNLADDDSLKSNGGSGGGGGRLEFLSLLLMAAAGCMRRMLPRPPETG